MYRQLAPLLADLRADLRGTLPDLAGKVNADRLLDAYVEQLILYVGVDIANDSATAVALNGHGEMLASLDPFANEPLGFTQFSAWVDRLSSDHGARVVAVAAECTGVYYEEFWRYLYQATSYAQVLYNPRTTKHMGEVVSVKVRDDLVDAHLLAQQLRLGSTPESLPLQDPSLAAARDCARFVRDTAKSITRKKSQLKALVRTYNPALYRAFRGSKLYTRAGVALLRQHLFPQDIAALGEDGLAAFLAEHGLDDPGKARALLQAAKACFPRVPFAQVIRFRVQDLLDDIQRLRKRRTSYLKQGYQLIESRPETSIVRAIWGAGEVITLSLIAEIGDVSRFANGDQLASFLGLTSSKHVSGTTLHVTKRITKQGSPVGRYAAVQLAKSLSRTVPKYIAMYERIKARKPRGQAHFIALVAVARDFVSNVLYDMLTYHRPFYVEVDAYRAYRATRQQMVA
jgi:transposase